jgi:hypothetical protein
MYISGTNASKAVGILFPFFFCKVILSEHTLVICLVV